MTGTGLGGATVKLTRRGLLLAAGALPLVLRAAPAGAVPTPGIRARSEWGGDLRPKGALEREEDVRFLLVHHSETANGYRRDQVARQLRSIYEFHTGREKDWPDIAYNFFVDAHGGIWEGRTGSLSAPVKGSATGGSQGYALLCCFLGDLSSDPPTQAAGDAMARLLAWLAGTYGLDLTPGREVEFVSRGSNKWPKGSKVTTSVIAAHREMSETECPGDAGYAFVKGPLPAMVRAVAGASGAPATTAAPEPAPTVPATTAASTTTIAQSAPASHSVWDQAPPVAGHAAAADAVAGTGAGFPWLLTGGGVASLGVAAGVGGALLLRRRRAAASEWGTSSETAADLRESVPFADLRDDEPFTWDRFERSLHEHDCGAVDVSDSVRDEGRLRSRAATERGIRSSDGTTHPH